MGDLKHVQDAFDAASDFLSPVLNRGMPLSNTRFCAYRS